MTGEEVLALFGADSVELVNVEGHTIQVYVFGNAEAAAERFATASNPQATTISWVWEPRFVKMENLFVGVVLQDKALAEMIVSALQD